MHAIDTQLTHVWMVRAFVKHSDEAAEDEDQDMVCEDAHSVHLVGDLLHLDKDLLEWQTHINQMEACFLLILT